MNQEYIIRGADFGDVMNKMAGIVDAWRGTAKAGVGSQAPATLEPTPLEQVIATAAAAAPEPKKGGKKARREAVIKDGDTDFPVVTGVKEAEPQPEPVAVEAKALTIAEVRAAAQSVMKTENGTIKIMEVLKGFGADRVSALKEEQYAEFVAACAKVTA